MTPAEHRAAMLLMIDKVHQEGNYLIICAGLTVLAFGLGFFLMWAACRP